MRSATSSTSLRPSGAVTPDAALILAAHGSRRAGAMDGIAAHAAALSRCGPFREVRIAALFGGGATPAEVLNGLCARRAVIVPMMMCDGQTARCALPAAFGPITPQQTLTFCPPIGTHPELAALIAARAIAASLACGWRPAAVTVLIVGHGSTRGSESSDVTRRQAERVRRRGVFADVAAAFLAQQPRLSSVLATLAGPVIVVGLFAGFGHHAAEDVHDAIAESGRDDICYTGPIGSDPGIVDVVLAIARQAGDAATDPPVPG